MGRKERAGLPLASELCAAHTQDARSQTVTGHYSIPEEAQQPASVLPLSFESSITSEILGLWGLGRLLPIRHNPSTQHKPGRSAGWQVGRSFLPLLPLHPFRRSLCRPAQLLASGQGGRESGGQGCLPYCLSITEPWGAGVATPTETEVELSREAEAYSVQGDGAGHPAHSPAVLSIMSHPWVRPLNGFSLCQHGFPLQYGGQSSAQGCGLEDTETLPSSQEEGESGGEEGSAFSGTKWNAPS